jgi:hypothetical protein
MTASGHCLPRSLGGQQGIIGHGAHQNDGEVAVEYRKMFTHVTKRFEQNCHPNLFEHFLWLTVVRGGFQKPPLRVLGQIVIGSDCV